MYRPVRALTPTLSITAKVCRLAMLLACVYGLWLVGARATGPGGIEGVNAYVVEITSVEKYWRWWAKRNTSGARVHGVVEPRDPPPGGEIPERISMIVDDIDARGHGWESRANRHLRRYVRIVHRHGEWVTAEADQSRHFMMLLGVSFIAALLSVSVYFDPKVPARDPTGSHLVTIIMGFGAAPFVFIGFVMIPKHGLFGLAPAPGFAVFACVFYVLLMVPPVWAFVANRMIHRKNLALLRRTGGPGVFRDQV